MKFGVPVSEVLKSFFEDLAKPAKASVLACLDSGGILHTERANIGVKNLLATGEVTPDDVATVISRARGTDYQCRPHHVVASVDVHIIKTRFGGIDW